MAMKRSLAGAVGLTALTIAFLAPAAPSFGAVTCDFSPPDHLLSISAVDSFTRIARSGQSIAVDDGHQPVDCRGSANVHNTDLVQVTHTGRSADTVDLSGGPFAPGFSNPATGVAEIKLQYLTPSFVDIRGTAGPDALSFAAGGVNLDGDDDPDVIGAFTTLLVEGRGGNDVIGPQAGHTRAAPRRVLFGQSGNDTLTATPDGSIIHGGNGHDRLIGGRGKDNLTGGRGSDLIRGGKGRDLIRAIDGTRDRVNCGPGMDRAKVDGIDKVKNCERLIKVKRRGPVKKH